MRPKPWPNRLLLALALLGAIARAQAPEPALPWVFADHMVLQCGRPIPVWGTVAPGAEVVVTFGEARVAGTSTPAGTFRVDLPAQAASNVGRELVVRAGDHERRLRDVVVGEVWLCAGQSNMDFPLSRTTGGKEAATKLQNAQRIRLCNRSGSTRGGARRLTPEQLAKLTPTTFYSGTWQRPADADVGRFSGVGAFFGLALHEALETPIGLIDVSIGGSTTEGWISRDRLAREPDLAPLLDDYLTTHLSHPFIRERAQVHLGDWVENGKPSPRPRHFFEPSFLFDSAIAPLAPFAVRGVLWYQGESNAHLPAVADRLFRIMVDEWRERWQQPTLPFYFAQLPAMGRENWPELREYQASWQDLPHTGMAVTIDVGHPTDVHPKNKRPVGERLARIALADTYEQDVASIGPTLARVERRGDELLLTFAFADGLRWAEGRGATGFEIAGADRRFYPATAEIRGQQVALRSPEVAEPRDARYAWAPVPEWSLVNEDGLPAAPFRSHEWRPQRVACIGDSITRGHGIKDPTQTYPARLQQLLGDGFDVRGFGHNGCGVVLSTMRGDWPRAFRRNAEHIDALLFEPHVVVSNLGINDIMAWSQTGKEFGRDYTALIDDYRALASKPKVLLWTPLAPLFPGQKFYGSKDEPKIHKAIARVAKKTRSASIDVNTALRDKPQWFPDHIHPNAEGAAAIADIVHNGLIDERIAKRSPRPLRVYVVTGQSNSLGTTADPNVADTSPGEHAADEHIRFFWSNRSTRAGDGPATLIGDSGNRFLPLQAQQGEGRNKTFWGPEVGFARSLYASGERDFVVVKASRGGGGNGYWSKGAADDHMYRHVVATVEAAVAMLPSSRTVEVAALIYVQGESDNQAEANAAGKRLHALAKNLRRDFPNARRMRVLVGGIAAAGARRDVVRSQQRQATERDARMHYVDTSDLAGNLYDKLHFDRAAKLTIGERLAEAWRTLGGARAFARSKR